MCKNAKCPARGENAATWEHLLAREVDRLLAADPGEVYRRLGRAFETTVIERALAAADGCHQCAAGLLGIGDRALARRLACYGIEARAEDPAEAGFVPLGLRDLFKT